MVLQAQRVEPVLTARHPRVKVVKLHWDLYLRFMAWTRDEMDEYVGELEDVLAPAIRNRDVLVVGQSLRDEGVRRLVLGTGGIDWFAAPRTLPEHLANFDQVRVVVDERCRFESLFPAIAQFLRIEHQPPAAGEPGEATTATSTTMDDLMAAVVAVHTSPDMPTGTGFLLANPRVIVTDRFPLSVPQTVGEAVWVTTSDGRRIETGIVAVEDQPLSAVVLAVPNEVTEKGLTLGPAAVPPAGTHLSLAVAAGDSTGISDDEVVSGTKETLDLAPVGRVSGLVQIQAMTAGGSSGAPVVDDTMRVVGMVVAGATDEDNPQTFMLPIDKWRHIAMTILGRLTQASSRRYSNPRG
jgi:S1-C subfamily serine protease